MKEARPANIRSLLLSALILSSSAFQVHAYYHPDEGRWLSRDPIEEEGGLNVYAFARNNPALFTDYLGLVAPKCVVKSFGMRVSGWGGGWPNFSLFGPPTYSRYLEVKFTLELDDCSTKEDCVIDQLLMGQVSRAGAVTGDFPSWTTDGGLWWTGSAWTAGSGSWSFWGGKTATFKDEPGFNGLVASDFPVYWAGAGGNGKFEYKTRVKDHDTGVVVKELKWGMRIKYSSPASGVHYFYL